MQICKLHHRGNVTFGEILQEAFKINVFFFFQKDETLIVLRSPLEFEPLNHKSMGRILELSDV